MMQNECMENECDDLMQRAVVIVRSWGTNKATALGVIERDIVKSLRAAAGQTDHAAVCRLAEAIGLLVIEEVVKEWQP